MAKLTADEEKLLRQLSEKQKAPEPSSGGGSHRLNVNLDLSDANQIKLAQRFGFLPPDDEPDEPADEPADDEPEDDVPNRRGYFGS